jgi:hypothetical protein
VFHGTLTAASNTVSLYHNGAEIAPSRHNQLSGLNLGAMA